MNISSLKYHLNKTVLPCVNFMRGERGYGRRDLTLILLLSDDKFFRLFSNFCRLKATIFLLLIYVKIIFLTTTRFKFVLSILKAFWRDIGSGTNVFYSFLPMTLT